MRRPVVSLVFPDTSPMRWTELNCPQPSRPNGRMSAVRQRLGIHVWFGSVQVAGVSTQTAFAMVPTSDTAKTAALLHEPTVWIPPSATSPYRSTETHCPRSRSHTSTRLLVPLLRTH